MVVYIHGHSFVYELQNVARMFVYDVTVEERQPRHEERLSDYAYLRLARTRGETVLTCTARVGTFETGKLTRLEADADKKECEFTLACMLYDVLCAMTGKLPKWGVITGIRPAKYVEQMLDAGLSDNEILWRLEARHRVSDDKARLCLNTAKVSKRVGELNGKKSCSIYVSIPFCPSRCSYCSFISRSVERDKGLISPYIDLLCTEISDTARMIERLGLKLETVYIGGGTPTVLDERNLQRLTDAINGCIDIKALREFSVEAGRPDTVNAEKLRILKRAGVTRISINPQTGNDAVLALIGRKHTAKDIERCFFEAREAGFDNINADLIAGLPGDDIDSFKRTVEWLERFSPENITVHALTLKRASGMTEKRLSASEDASLMVDYACERLQKDGYFPYYMYKQKGTVDSLENTGYAKPGTECLYNVFIMDEIQTILACGAGGVTKLVNRQANDIERIYNYKYPTEYISGFSEIQKRKKGVSDFYDRQV